MYINVILVLYPMNIYVISTIKISTISRNENFYKICWHRHGNLLIYILLDKDFTLALYWVKSKINEKSPQVANKNIYLKKNAQDRKFENHFANYSTFKR